MHSLNPSLFRALQQFGEVRLTDPGVAMTALYVPTTDGRAQLKVSNPGEYLRVNCPYCGDTKFRLWVNHRWGVYDQRTGTCNRWLAICYNEGCLANDDNREDFIELTTWYHREARARRVQIKEGASNRRVSPLHCPRILFLLATCRRDTPRAATFAGAALIPRSSRATGESATRPKWSSVIPRGAWSFPSAGLNTKKSPAMAGRRRDRPRR